MTDPLRAHYLATDYHVRLPGGGNVSIHIGAALPPALLAWLRDDAEPWAFITAWNPQSQAQPRSVNRRAQRDLLAALRTLTPPPRICAGIGVGQGGWREPSLFVLGADFTDVDTLMHRFAQRAIVRARGPAPAELHLIPQQPDARRSAKTL